MTSSGPSESEAAEEAARVVWQRRKPEAIKRIGILEDVIAALVEGRLDAHLRLAGEDAAHKLAGSLGSFGFSRGSELAFQAEALVGGHGSLEVGDARRLAEWVDGMRVEIERPVGLIDEASATMERDAAADGFRGDGKLDVVMVEDDEVLAELLLYGLRNAGLVVEWIDDGGDAVDTLAGDRPRLVPGVVLLDVDLPAVNGIGVLRAMADSGALRNTRVIMLTARASEHETVETFEIGAFDHVAKPFSLPVLIQRIRRALEG